MAIEARTITTARRASEVFMSKKVLYCIIITVIMKIERVAGTLVSNPKCPEKPGIGTGKDRLKVLL